MDLQEEAGKENEQTLTNLSPAEEATGKDETEIDIFVPLLSCLASVAGTDLTAFGLYWRPRSRFSHTDLPLG